MSFRPAAAFVAATHNTSGGPSRPAQPVQESSLESQYLSALSAHFNYWTSADVALFVLRAVHGLDVLTGGAPRQAQQAAQLQQAAQQQQQQQQQGGKATSPGAAEAAPMGMCARSVVVVAGSGQLCLRATSLPPYDGPHMSMNLHTARFLVHEPAYSPIPRCILAVSVRALLCLVSQAL